MLRNSTLVRRVGIGFVCNFSYLSRANCPKEFVPSVESYNTHRMRRGRALILHIMNNKILCRWNFAISSAMLNLYIPVSTMITVMIIYSILYIFFLSILETSPLQSHSVLQSVYDKNHLRHNSKTLFPTEKKNIKKKLRSFRSLGFHTKSV